jgi:hypothetical protein
MPGDERLVGPLVSAAPTSCTRGGQPRGRGAPAADPATPEPALAVAAPEALQAEPAPAYQPEVPEPDGRTKIAQTIKDYLAERGGDDGIAQLARCAKVSERAQVVRRDAPCRTIEQFLANPLMELSVATSKKIAKGAAIPKQGDTIEREGMTLYFGD